MIRPVPPQPEYKTLFMLKLGVVEIWASSSWTSSEVLSDMA